MSRLTAHSRQDLEATGRELWDTVTRTRGSVAETEDGALTGPFNAWLRSPTLGKQLVNLGTTLRFESSIDQRLLELAVVTVAAHWKVEFEWWAHTRRALNQGIRQEALDAIRDGQSPDFEAADEQIVYGMVRSLLVGGHPESDVYDNALTLLGEAGLVELVALCGYYALVSFTLNAFDVKLPPDVLPAWA